MVELQRLPAWFWDIRFLGAGKLLRNIPTNNYCEFQVDEVLAIHPER